jgi:hypothetical protein
MTEHSYAICGNTIYTTLAFKSQGAHAGFIHDFSTKLSTIACAYLSTPYLVQKWASTRRQMLFWSHFAD